MISLQRERERAKGRLVKPRSIRPRSLLGARDEAKADDPRAAAESKHRFFRSSVLRSLAASA
jgi:hypothetical protein